MAAAHWWWPRRLLGTTFALAVLAGCPAPVPSGERVVDGGVNDDAVGAPRANELIEAEDAASGALGAFDAALGAAATALGALDAAVAADEFPVRDEAGDGRHGARSGRGERRCPAEMVDVGGRVCVDRYEATLVDVTTGLRWSPHYPPEPALAARMFAKWQDARTAMGSPAARALALPPLPDLARLEQFRPRAVAVKGVVPQGYVSGKVAAEACARAGKRLCRRDEWTFACRGEGQTKYPYGETYRAGVCNVFRDAHPAQKLHGDASIGHSDPRLGTVEVDDGPLLRRSGATPRCVSRWGDDGIFDMVGNQDEWVDDPDGTFVGGFFSRPTREGCDAVVSVHPLAYWDYSLGVRCCR